MEILVLGLNHKTAPVELRERFSIPGNRVHEFLGHLRDREIFEERLVLSTCNRTELYGAAQNPDRSVRQAKEFLSEYARMDLEPVADKFYLFKQPHSVEHLFSVASGLDSMVLGETEILGQVKDSYSLAQGSQHTGKALNALFQRSFKTAKQLRTHTEIGTRKVGIASIAVDLASKIFKSLRGTRVMVIGTGEMATQVTKAIVSRGAFPLVVSSRHFERAVAMTQMLGGEAVHFDRFQDRVKEVDILIASTEAPCLLVQEYQVKTWMKLRQERPLFLIDIAVPRNVDTAVEKLDNVYLYNIDDLQKIADENRAFRETQLKECFRFVKNQSGLYMNWFAREFGS